MRESDFEIKLDSDSKLPSEIELIPSEDVFVGFDGRVFRALDKNAIINATNEKLKYVVIDENHKTDYTQGESAEAMGWMSNFFVKEDNSVWASVEWTKVGAEKIISKEYKYISPVYATDKSTNIISILRAAITNNPNLKLTALNNKKGDKTMKELEELEELKKEKKSLIEAKESAEKSLEKLEKNNGELEHALNEAKSQLSALGKELAELKKSSLEKEACSAVEKAIEDGKIAPSAKEVYINLCMEQGGMERFSKIMESTPPAGIFNNVDFKKSSNDKVELNETDKAISKMMGYSEEEYKAIQEKGA